MVITVFRARLREDVAPEALAELEQKGARMAELASAMPGFVSYKDFAAPDGENVTIVEFDTHEHQAAWRSHPEHVAVQHWGRESVFSSYRIQVCDLLRTTQFPLQHGDV